MKALLVGNRKRRGRFQREDINVVLYLVLKMVIGGQWGSTTPAEKLQGRGGGTQGQKKITLRDSHKHRGGGDPKGEAMEEGEPERTGKRCWSRGPEWR